MAATENLQMGRRAALCEHCDSKPTFNGGNLSGKAGAVIDDFVLASLQRQGLDGATFRKAAIFINSYR
jgi:hypothetical protein